jgi:hypothetical protein
LPRLDICVGWSLRERSAAVARRRLGAISTQNGQFRLPPVHVKEFHATPSMWGQYSTQVILTACAVFTHACESRPNVH